MEVRDVLIVGGGISAHTAALYTARASMKPLVLSGFEPDQLSLTTLVENFPGFPDGIMGPELVENAKKQARRFGAEYVQEVAESVKKTPNGFEVVAGGKTFAGRTLIISTGASARMLNIPGEKEFLGRGLSTCATCDAALYKNKIAIVIGGGDSAMEESLALYKFASKITLVHRRNAFRASKIMQDRVRSLKDRISVVWNAIPVEVQGQKFVTGLKVKDAGTGKETVLSADGVFLAIGHNPNTGFLKGFLDLDANGYVKVQGVKTSVPGVFAAGDVMDPVYRQAVTSAGTGCMAALEAEKFIEHLKAAGQYA
ncbi:MAG: thioredoxin-disulfide reductase [Candidatus Diapherotrites archaeon]|nr:thioredoxin-disulfide reductase [Candidatus Diapherotrites archaeon]